MRMLYSTLVLLQQAQTAHDLFERRLAALIEAVGVVQFLRAIDAQAERKRLAFKNSHHSSSRRVPLVAGISNSSARFHVYFLARQRPCDRTPTPRGGFAALPCHRDLARAMAVDQRGDIALEHLVAHSEAAAGIVRLVRGHFGVGHLHG